MAPSTPTSKRNYKKEYRDYHGKPEQIKRRIQRTTLRYKLEKEGKVSHGDGKEIDHSGYNRKGKLNNGKYKIVSRAANRKRQPKRDGSQD